ncbi:MAG: acylphosphatase [Parachlamydiales bacterium]|nr:acylphosphatase [Parachlamydiales bacterium]
MQEIHIFVSGVVQGVGFRAAVKRHALLHNIKGYVRNLPDGRVEICAQGRGDQINQFIHTVQAKPGAGSISAVETKFKPMSETYSSFEVR